MPLRDFTRIILPQEETSSSSKTKVLLKIKNQNILLANFPFSIGSHKSNDLVVRDPYVSRHHCIITQSSDQYFIKDLESTNGTMLNDKKISKEKLKFENDISLGHISLSVSVHRSEKKIPQHGNNTFHGIISESPKMHHVFSLIKKFAPLEEPVFILGETGSGKELVAQALHKESDLSGSLIALNCAALPQHLCESELFGHVKGAFTGAVNSKKGAFELADGGTLFLDEIAELPLEQQSKLLRTLETGKITPLGSEKSIKVSVRVIAATHQKLKERVQKKKFREDLYFRLNVLPISIPNLNERKKDIPLLAGHFAALKSSKIKPLVLQTLKTQKWRGNIRELKNTIFHLAALSEDKTITMKDWNQIHGTHTPNEKLRQLEKKQIQDSLILYNWNISKASASLGISRSTLYRRVEKYKILRPSE